MITKDETLRMALEALEIEDMACRYEKEPTPEHIAKAITALREALAEQQEPVAKKKHEPTINLGKYAGTYGGYIKEQK